MGYMKNSKKRMALFSHIVLIAVLLLSLYPFILMLFNSVKSKKEMRLNPLGFPTEFHFENFTSAWVEGRYTVAFFNSFKIMIITIVIVLIVCGCCAYALSKLRPKGANIVFNYFLFTMSVSVSLCLVPLYFMFANLNLMNTHLGLILLYIGGEIPFTVIVMRAFFIGIPDEILESARIDGCTEIGVLARIALPIAKPIFLTCSLLTALAVWNEFYFANSFIYSDELRTVATRYITFAGRYGSDWSKISAAGLITVLPMIILYVVFQRQFIEGLTSGSLKG